MICRFDHIQIVFDDQYCVPHIHQPLQYLDQLVHIRRVQARGGLVQNIDGSAGGHPCQLCGQLDPLGLTAGQGGAGLAQLHIA